MKTKYSQFLLFPQPFRSYPMSVMFSYCLIGSCPTPRFFFPSQPEGIFTYSLFSSLSSVNPRISAPPIICGRVIISPRIVTEMMTATSGSM